MIKELVKNFFIGVLVAITMIAILGILLYGVGEVALLITPWFGDMSLLATIALLLIIVMGGLYAWLETIN